jgi:hypothetical protein
MTKKTMPSSSAGNVRIGAAYQEKRTPEYARGWERHRRPRKRFFTLPTILGVAGWAFILISVLAERFK